MLHDAAILRKAKYLGDSLLQLSVVQFSDEKEFSSKCQPCLGKSQLQSHKLRPLCLTTEIFKLHALFFSNYDHENNSHLLFSKFQFHTREIPQNYFKSVSLFFPQGHVVRIRFYRCASVVFWGDLSLLGCFSSKKERKKGQTK